MLNSMYKISVIVPAYNIAQYLPRCLDSILNQTHKNLEIIVISDGSTDETNDIIIDYAQKDSRIVPVFKANSGVSSTRNKGLDIASGDYIGFVDGDDYIEPDMYELLINNAIEYNADISHCGYQMVFPSRIDYYYDTDKRVLQDNETGVYDLLSAAFVEPGIWNKLYKKEVLQDVRMDCDIRINEDLLFNFFAFKKANISFYQDKPMYHYILRKGSAATSKYNFNKLIDPVRVREKIFIESKDYSERIQTTAYSNYIKSIIYAYRTVRINKLSQFYNEVKKYRNILKSKDNKKLTRKIKIEKFMVSYLPLVYTAVYKFYDKFISKNKDKYEVK